MNIMTEESEVLLRDFVGGSTIDYDGRFVTMDVIEDFVEGGIFMAFIAHKTFPQWKINVCVVPALADEVFLRVCNEDNGNVGI